MITSIVFDVDDTIYDQQAPYRVAVEKCFPDFDMSCINQAYIRFRHYSDALSADLNVCFPHSGLL